MHVWLENRLFHNLIELRYRLLFQFRGYSCCAWASCSVGYFWGIFRKRLVFNQMFIIWSKNRALQKTITNFPTSTFDLKHLKSELSVT